MNVDGESTFSSVTSSGMSLWITVAVVGSVIITLCLIFGSCYLLQSGIMKKIVGKYSTTFKML